MDSPTDSDTESEPVSSGDRMQTAKSSTSTGSRKISTEQTTALNSFYKNGMKGEAARFTVFISRASKKTGLSIAQVKRWINKKIYRLKHSRQQVTPVYKVARMSTKWQQFLKDFGRSEDGKTAICSGLPVFMSAAKEAYSRLTDSERDALRPSTSQPSAMTRKEIIREGVKAFQKIQKEMMKLEQLGYSGFAFGFFEDDVQFVSSSNASCCSSPALIEYLHAVIIAGNPPSLSPAVESNAVQESDLLPSKLDSKRSKLSHNSSASKGSKTSKQPTHLPASKPSSKRSDHPPPSKLSNIAPATNPSSKQSDHPPASKPPSKLSNIPPATNPSSKQSDIPPASKPPTKVSRQTKPPSKHPTSRKNPHSKRVNTRTNIQSPPAKRKQNNDESLLGHLLFQSSLSEENDERVPDNKDRNDVCLVSDSPVREDPNVWLSGLNLYKRDKEILKSSVEWLTDSIIDASQQLLKKQTSNSICGLMTPLFSKKEGIFPPVPPCKPFIQIIHADECHWITVSNINVCTKSEFSDAVVIYDSSHYPLVSFSTKTAVCLLVQPKSDVLLFDVANCMNQTNGSDCGLHAIASATELAHGFDPVFCQWDTDIMRQHLLSCLENGKLERFPTTKRRRIALGNRIRKKQSTVEKIYCKCRMINDPKQPMIVCSNCRVYYHMHCEGLNPDGSYKGKWFCCSCENERKLLTLH